MAILQYEVKPLDRIQELEQEMKRLIHEIENGINDCATDEAGNKVKRCKECMESLYVAGQGMICLKELYEEEQ